MSDQQNITELTAELSVVLARKLEEIKKVTGTTRILALNSLIERGPERPVRASR